MKVKDLIKELKKAPPDLNVYIGKISWLSGNHYAHPIDRRGTRMRHICDNGEGIVVGRNAENTRDAFVIKAREDD